VVLKPAIEVAMEAAGRADNLPEAALPLFFVAGTAFIVYVGTTALITLAIHKFRKSKDL
jgi:hypothetical protein